ncbi:MAG: hypothetical protein QXQ43_00560 [Nitrososphaerota archaeon]
MKTIAFDYDNTIVYEGTSKPIPGMIELLKALKKNGIPVIIITANPAKEQIYSTLVSLGVEPDLVTNNKLPVDIYICDKTITFDGNVKSLINKIKNFKPWYEK